MRLTDVVEASAALKKSLTRREHYSEASKHGMHKEKQGKQGFLLYNFLAAVVVVGWLLNVPATRLCI